MQNHMIKFSEWLEQRDPELFIEMNMSRRGFMASLGAAAATSMVGNKVLANDGFSDKGVDNCGALKDLESDIQNLRKEIIEKELKLDDNRFYSQIQNKHKPFTDSRIGKDYQNYFPDPHGTINNPYFANTGDKKVYKDFLDHIDSNKTDDLKKIKYLKDQIENLKKTPTPRNQEEIKHYEKIIDTYNHVIEKGYGAKPKKDYHPHEDYYDDVKKIKRIESDRKTKLDDIADLKFELQSKENQWSSLDHDCGRQTDNIIYRKLKSQHGNNTLNISPKDTLYILKHGSKGNARKLKELALELGKSNIERLEPSEVNELVSMPFENGEYFKTLINILGTEKIKSIYPSVDSLLRNFYKFVEKSYDNYLQDIFDFVIGRISLINLPINTIFLILYTSNSISSSNRLTDAHEKYLYIIIKNIGMYNMAKLGEEHWQNLDEEKDFKNKYGVNIIKKVYEGMKPKTYAPSILGK